MLDVKKLIAKMLPMVYHTTNGAIVNVPAGGGSVTNLHRYTPSKGTWLILSKVTVHQGSSTTKLQNRLPNSNVRLSESDNGLAINNYVIFTATGSNSVAFDTYSNVASRINWEFTAIKIK